MKSFPLKTPQNKDSSFGARWRRWTRPPRRLSFTTAGKYFVLITIGIGFGAINTGDNLLFLLLGMMLSLILASGILSETVIRRLHAQRNPPHRVFADSNAPGTFRVTNPAGWPSLSIEVAERSATGLKGPLAGRKIGPQHIPWWKFWRRKKRKSKDAESPRTDAAIAQAYTMRVEARDRQDLPTRYIFPARGRCELPGLDIITRFPFGLFEKRRELDEAAQITVYPAASEAREWLSDIHAHFGDITRHKRGSGEDFFGLRDYQPGEDQRLIHWKATARRGEVVVRETESTEQRSVELFLLNTTGLPAQQRHTVNADFEVGIQRTFGLIQTLLQAGWRVGLRTLDAHLPASSASNHFERMLETLALIDLRDGHATSPVGSRAAGAKSGATGRPKDAQILIGLEGPTSLIAADFDLVLAVEKGAVSTVLPNHAAKPEDALPMNSAQSKAEEAA